MEYKPLSAETRRVFEWIAGHVESKVCFWFAEVRRECGIASDHELHLILMALQQYPKRAGLHWAIVKAIYPAEQHGEGAFEVGTHANRAWLAYCSWEKEHTCPECGQPRLKTVTLLRCENPECKHEHETPVAPARRTHSLH